MRDTKTGENRTIIKNTEMYQMGPNGQKWVKIKRTKEKDGGGVHVSGWTIHPIM